jgi:hypothetical protein
MARIGAVLLAAGASTRFGAGNKLLAELGGRPLIAHAADALLASGVDEIVVVTGRDSEQVRQILARTAVRFAHNEGWIRGMGSSIASGLRALGSQPSGIDSSKPAANASWCRPHRRALSVIRCCGRAAASPSWHCSVARRAASHS